MEENIINMMYGQYKIEVNHVQKMQGGLSADAFLIEGKNQKYFLKVFDKNRYTAQCWIKRIDDYIPVVIWLHENTSFGDELIVPVFTTEKQYKFENENHIFILYPYIDGVVPAKTALTSSQQESLGSTVAKLHYYGQRVPTAFVRDIETFDVSFCDELVDIIKTKSRENLKLYNILMPYRMILEQKIILLKEYANELTASNLPFVLCHTDIHGWNLIQAEKLYLLDWEGLKLAPVEADLFSFTEGFFFDYSYEIVMKTYCSIHRDYVVNEQAMQFYRTRRRLEDISDFAKSILYDGLTDQAIMESVNHLKRQCSCL